MYSSNSVSFCPKKCVKSLYGHQCHLKVKEDRDIGKAKRSSSTKTSRLCEHLPFVVGPEGLSLRGGKLFSHIYTWGQGRDAGQAVLHCPLFLLLTLPAAWHPIKLNWCLWRWHVKFCSAWPELDNVMAMGNGYGGYIRVFWKSALDPRFNRIWHPVSIHHPNSRMISRTRTMKSTWQPAPRSPPDPSLALVSHHSWLKESSAGTTLPWSVECGNLKRIKADQGTSSQTMADQDRGRYSQVQPVKGGESGCRWMQVDAGGRKLVRLSEIESFRSHLRILFAKEFSLSELCNGDRDDLDNPGNCL